MQAFAAQTTSQPEPLHVLLQVEPSSQRIEQWPPLQALLQCAPFGQCIVQPPPEHVKFDVSPAGASKLQPPCAQVPSWPAPPGPSTVVTEQPARTSEKTSTKPTFSMRLRDSTVRAAGAAANGLGNPARIATWQTRRARAALERCVVRDARQIFGQARCVTSLARSTSW
jgi:hypothetical protein